MIVAYDIFTGNNYPIQLVAIDLLVQQIHDLQFVTILPSLPYFFTNTKYNHPFFNILTSKQINKLYNKSHIKLYGIFHAESKLHISLNNHLTILPESVMNKKIYMNQSVI